MAILVGAARIRDRLELTDKLPTLTHAVEEALKISATEMERILRTRFAQAAVVDEFHVVKSRQTGKRFSVKLKLSRGFLDTGVTVTAIHATTRLNLDKAGEITDLRSPDDLVTVDHDAGVVMINDTEFDNQYVRIGYTAGFTVDSSTPPVYQSIPQWLEDLAVQHAIIELNTNPNLRVEEQKPADVSLLARLFQRALAPQIRYYPGALLPLPS